jgi:hypothetical protein
MADGVRYVDHTEAVRARILAEMNRRLDRSAITVVNEAKQSLSVAFPPSSSRGEPPAKRTGRLRASVAWEPGPPLTRRVGTNVFYGRIWELDGRPWLRPALLKSAQRIEAILGAPIV